MISWESAREGYDNQYRHSLPGTSRHGLGDIFVFHSSEMRIRLFNEGKELWLKIAAKQVGNRVRMWTGNLYLAVLTDGVLSQHVVV